MLQVARDLLGSTLACHGVSVRVTETEAYGGPPGGRLPDPGSHAFRGRTPRTEPMFGPAATTYVYFTYGMHFLLCLVTGPPEQAEAVLIRAGEVVAGHDLAAARRPGVSPREWCRGPARLASTLALTTSHTGLRFVRPREIDLVVSTPQSTGRAPECSPAIQGGVDLQNDATSQCGGTSPSTVSTGPRVGVSGPGGDPLAYPWRFWLAGERSVSVYRPAKPRDPARRDKAGWA